MKCIHAYFLAAVAEVVLDAGTLPEKGVTNRNVRKDHRCLEQVA